VTWEVLTVAVTALVVLAFALYLCAALFRGLVRQQARERELLLNQIMHLAGRTWQPPPEPQPATAAMAGEQDTLIMIDPSQQPDY
jgi:hypothetical protein